MKKIFTLFALLTMLTGGLMARGLHTKHAIDDDLQQGLTELRGADAASLAGRFLGAERLFTVALQQKSLAATMKLDSATYEDYTSEKAWKLSWRDIYLYNAQNHLTEIRELDWDDSSQSLSYESRTTLSYNAQGRLSEMAYYDKEDGEMKMFSRMEFFYDGAGRIDSLVDYSESFDGGDLEMSGYQKYHYDNNGRVSYIASFEYDEDLEAYIELMRRVNTYNAAGRRTRSQVVIKDEDTEMVFSETEYFYNASGKLTASEYSGMSFPAFVLEKRSRSEYDYDSDGDQTQSRWLDREGGTWVLEDRDVLSYHPTIKASGVIMPFAIMTSIYAAETELDYSFVKLPMGSVSYLVEGSEDRTDSRSLFHYTGLSNTQVGEKPEYAFRVYPNPVTTQLQLNWNMNYDQLTLEVFHITGARVLQQTVSANQAVDTQHLPGGMYLYRASHQGQVVYSGKFMKQ